MAKNKMPLSPEQAEIKAMKKEKSSNNFTKFIAIVLALALAAGTFVLGQSAAKKAVEEAGQNVVVNGGDTNAPSGNDDVPAGDNVTDAPSDDATDAPAGDDNTADAPAGDANAPAGDNDAAFSKGNYKFARVCAYTPDGAIDVGNATGTLNKIIQGIDENASLDTVVGGFLGIGNRDGEVKGGKIPEGMNKQYALKAMTLTAADIKSATANGNKYVVKLGNFANPQKDGKNAMSRATNDFFTHQEVVDGITSITTLITLVALYILGVASIKEFAFPLIVGVICGCYSSVFLASQFWVLLKGKSANVVAK